MVELSPRDHARDHDCFILGFKRSCSFVPKLTCFFILLYNQADGFYIIVGL